MADKINSKDKGSRCEREAVKIFNDRFGENLFKRTPSSGAMIGGSNRKTSSYLTEEQKLAFASDIITPVWFKFIIEHKAYADKASIWEFFNDKSNLNNWLKQVEDDAVFVNKQPMLIIKYNNHKRIVFIKEKKENYYFEYKGWFCYWLEDLLTNEDIFFKL